MLNNVEMVMNKVVARNGKTINIALIGYGFVGKTFHAPLIQSVDGLKLAVVSSRDEERSNAISGCHRGGHA
jgi:predicted dehydrogenase